jgi:hypothetical protein
MMTLTAPLDPRRAAVVALLAIACLVHLGPVRASGLGDTELDTRFSAKVAKERTRVTTLEKQQQRRDARGAGRSDTGSEAGCGSQNIGNVDTGGRIGTTPREVFVFAPNAVNIVSGRGCR